MSAYNSQGFRTFIVGTFIMAEISSGWMYQRSVGYYFSKRQTFLLEKIIILSIQNRWYI